MPKWEFIVFRRDGDRWPGRPVGDMVTAAGAYRTFAEAKQHAVASERAETGESPGNRYSVWDARKQVWWPSTRNHAGLRGRVENEYGLTFEEWLAAAGGRKGVYALVKKGPLFGAAAVQSVVNAWRGGEDPSDWRKAVDDANYREYSKRNAAGSRDRSRRDESIPKTYLSFSEGRYRVIHQAMPISPDKATAVEALAAASQFNLKVSDRAWDGDRGKFVPFPTARMLEEAHLLAEAKASSSANRARSPARARLGKKALPRSSEERVASIRDLGGYDAGAFYSVKAGRIYRRYRKAGRGLGKGALVGTLPGYRKGMFYFVRNGVVYARSRRK